MCVSTRITTEVRDQGRERTFQGRGISIECYKGIKGKQNRGTKPRLESRVKEGTTNVRSLLGSRRNLIL